MVLGLSKLFYAVPLKYIIQSILYLFFHYLSKTMLKFLKDIERDASSMQKCKRCMIHIKFKGMHYLYKNLKNG
jgi:hypothetical protein